MTPDEIVAEINRKNRAALSIREDCEVLSREELLEMMDAAAMRGFQFGSNVALSMVQGALLVQLARVMGTDAKKPKL
jgi:hypothetical protein